MPSNEVVSAALQADPVPPERECVKVLSDFLKGAEDFLKIVGVANAQQGGAFPTNNNTAQQALATANAAQALAQQLQSIIGERRRGGPITIPTGNSVSAISFGTAMSTDNYGVSITPIGPATADDQQSWHVVEDTRTVNSVQIQWSGIGAGYAFVWEVWSL